MPQLSTQAAIVAAAAQVVGEQGYTAARVSDIAARAAVSSGSLYRHFGDRGRLLAAGLAKLLDDVVLGWAAPAPTAPLSVTAAVWAGVEPRGAGAAKAWAHAACLAPHFPVAAAAYASATARWEERIVAALSGQGLERRRAVAGARRLVSVGDGLRQRLVAVPADRDVCLDALEIAVGFELGPSAPAAGSGRGADAARAPGPGTTAREGPGHRGVHRGPLMARPEISTAPLPGPRPVEGDAARARIARAAAEVLSAQGVSAFKVSQVAAAAGVSTSLLYYHCPSRAAVAALGLEYVTNLAPSFAFLAPERGRKGHELARVTLLSEVEDTPVNRALNLIWNECAVLSVEDDELAAVHERFRHRWYQGLLQGVAVGIEDGSMLAASPHGLASLLLAYEEGLSLRWLGGTLEVDQARMVLEGGLSTVRAARR